MKLALLPRVSPPADTPRIPDYELIKVIGRGSYGDVWLARGVTGVFRAVKIVWRDRFADPQPYDREFKGLREFAGISLLESRQLALLHVGRNPAQGFFYYVMELADDAETGGEIDPERYVPNTLREVRERLGRLPAADVVRIGVELARGLSGLHTRGLVHRDIKPSNVILVGGMPKLADIGLVANASAALTFVGTEGYVPPEGPGAPAADVYSLGKMLYELATGLDRHDYPRLPANLDTVLDRKDLLELNEVCVRACEGDASKRHQDAGALLEDLLLLQAGKSVRRLRATERHLSRALRMTAVLAIAAAVALLGAWIAQQRADREMQLRAAAEAQRELDGRKNDYSATLTRAQRALEGDNLGRARRLLAPLQPTGGEADLRGFEWHALWREAQGDPALVAPTGGEIVKRIALSPDQKLVAGQVGDARTVIWDASTLREITTIPGTRLLAGFSPDSRWIVGTNAAQALQRWRLPDGEPDPHAAPGLNFPLRAVPGDRAWGLVKDVRNFAFGLRLWNFAENREEAAVPLAVPAESNWLFGPFPTMRDDGAECLVSIRSLTEPEVAWRLQVYDLIGRQFAHELQPDTRITALAISPDGRFLAAALADAGTISIFDRQANALVWRQPAGLIIVETLAFSPDGTRLLAGGATSTIRMFDARDGRTVGEFRGHDVGILALAWSADGKTFFAADSGGDLRRWNATPPASSRPGLRTGYATESWADMIGSKTLCVSDDGARFAASDGNDTFRVASTTTAGAGATRLTGTFPLAFEPDGRVVTLTADGTLRMFAADGTNAGEHRLLPTGARVRCAALSSNRKILIAGSPSGEVWIWNFVTRERIAERRAGESVLWAVVSPSGRIVVANGRDNIMRAWSSEDGRLLGEFSAGARRAVFSAAIAPDDRTVALGLETGEVEVRSLDRLDVARRLRTDSARLYGMAFSPDGTRLYSGGSNGIVHGYATDDWRLVITLATPPPIEGSDTTITTLAASASGNALLAYRADGAVRVWHAGGPR